MFPIQLLIDRCKVNIDLLQNTYSAIKFIHFQFDSKWFCGKKNRTVLIDLIKRFESFFLVTAFEKWNHNLGAAEWKHKFMLREMDP